MYYMHVLVKICNYTCGMFVKNTFHCVWISLKLPKRFKSDFSSILCFCLTHRNSTLDKGLC